ncbi:MAG: DEAD/DEAH box helicase [Thermodesulfobacteriota bacterium]|nr:DEAD/DEAH box helicase [Thermodesulfobacteriota bacterium]
MKPERNARRLLGITRAKATMWEYHVPESDHISIEDNPAVLFDLAIGSLGDLSASVNGEDFFPEEQLQDLRSTLKFAAQFFDSYQNSRLNINLNPFISICASASFYLCDIPGSALVLAEQLGEDCPDLDCLQLEDLLLWLLQSDLTTYFDDTDGVFGRYIDEISQQFLQFFENGKGQDRLFEYTYSLREIAYKKGSPRQLFFADAICAVVKKRIENSTWNCLPFHSDISVDEWRPFLKKKTFIRELWPAQRILGEHGLFNGESAVVQMPTSTGKTKATELIIRSAFLSNRASLALVVAPFRALCHEISGNLLMSFDDENVEINELSDVTQQDFSFDFSELVKKKQIFVVTPEKLHYALRHEPDFASTIGLVIFDEAHLFDDASRGVNYELLLSSVKAEIPKDSQTILVSAVIKNAAQIANWFLEDDSAVVTGTDFSPTNRSVAYASWTRKLGQLQFPILENVQDYGFFVPRVLETHSISDGRTTFPKRDKPNEIALYLGLNLVQNGCVAVFCGRKDSATVICRTAVQIYKKGLHIPTPASFSNRSEIKKLGYLIEQNMGGRSDAKKSADLGIFAHHGNVPHSIRLAVEYALQQELVKYVVCTSTLAQGVNLPIRYLIVTSVYQGRDRIKTRDFHNLIGRAGRAGKYTEGSIIFADPRIYDQRISSDNQWRWRQTNELLDPANSEDCASAIAEILVPIYNDKGDRYIDTKPLDIARIYLEDTSSFFNIADNIAQRHEGYSTDKVMQQLIVKLNAIRAIQSFLLAHTEEWENDSQGVESIVESTLAYALADDEGKQNLKDLFHLLKDDIEETVPDLPTRHVYGRTLLGLKDCVHIEAWVIKNLESLKGINQEEDLFRLIWPILKDHIHNRSFTRCNPPEVLELVWLEWINGTPYHRIFGDHLREARLGTGSRPRRFKVEHVVDLCENGFGYDGTLAVGAIAEIASFYGNEENDYSELEDRLLLLQKRLKYGLPSLTDVILCEIGFADRVLAQEVKVILKTSATNRRSIFLSMRKQYSALKKILSLYPSCYTEVIEKILVQ